MTDRTIIDAILARLVEVSDEADVPRLRDGSGHRSLRKLQEQRARKLASTAPWTEETARIDPRLRVEGEELVREADRRHGVRLLLDQLEVCRAEGRVTAAQIERLTRLVKRRHTEIAVDDPADWLERWLAHEHDRSTRPWGIIDPERQQELARLLDLVYGGFGEGCARRLCRDPSEVDEVVQRTADRVYRRFLNAETLGETGPVISGDAEAYLRRTARNAFLDLRAAGDDRPRFESLADDVAPPDEAAEIAFRAVDDAEADRQFTRRVVTLSWTAPSVLGPAFQQQWRAARTKSVRSVATRFAVVCVLTAEQRRSGSLVVPGLAHGLRRRVDADDGLWLRPPVNRVLGTLDPAWATCYRDRLPSADRTTRGARDGTTQEADMAYLTRVCRGDGQRDADPFGPLSARSHGVGALLRLVYGDLVSSEGSGQP